MENKIENQENKKIKKVVYTQNIRDLFKHHRKEGKELLWISNAIQVPYNTIKKWSSKLKKWEDLKDWRIWNSTKKKLFSDEDLKSFCKNNENATLKEIWNNFKVSDVAILKRFKKIKYSFKKKT